MKYCLSQGFSPTGFETNNTGEIIITYLTQLLYVIVGGYIIWKMCKLCSQAFSYSNFHIHQAYKFYTLALISTIMIIASRAVQLEFADKIRTARNDETLAPFTKDPYYQGWVLFNEVMGIISVYTVNLMYALNSFTLLMISNKCDFNRRESNSQIQAEDEQKQNMDHRFYIRVRYLLLYFVIPGCMLFSIFTELAFQSGWCIASRVIMMLSNLLIFLIMFYAFLNILLQRYRDHVTPLSVCFSLTKTKIIWIYIIIAMTIRQSFAWILAFEDFFHPSIKQYSGTLNHTASNILTLLYGLFITTIPIFLLSFLADKQLETQKEQLDKSQRIMYSSTII